MLGVPDINKGAKEGADGGDEESDEEGDEEGGHPMSKQRIHYWVSHEINTSFHLFTHSHELKSFVCLRISG